MSQGSSNVDKEVWNTSKNIFRPGIKAEEVKAGYDEWAESYDEVRLIKRECYVCCNSYFHRLILKLSGDGLYVFQVR